MENEELYRRAQAGEADAFERLHKQLANFIRSIALESCRHFGCTDVVSASLLEDLCAEGDLERVRQAQRLYHVEGKSAEEIAAALHLSDEATARLVGYNTHFFSVFDLLGSEEEGDPFERLLSDRQGISSEQIIYRKCCLELLEQLFQTLSAKDRSILGHTFGVYGYEKLSADELGLREMLSPDGVTKARKTALEHLRQRYPDSALYRWRRVFRKMRDV